MKRTTPLVCVLFLVLLTSYGQEFSKNEFSKNEFSKNEFSKNAFFVGGGVGLLSALESGLGGGITAGYQRTIWGDRLRVVPSFSIGVYVPSGEDNYGDPFMSNNLKCNVNFDVLKIKAFSLFIGSGPTLNTSITSSTRKLHFAWNALIGFRINPATRKTCYELLLFNGAFSRRFAAFTPTMRVIVKLK